MIALFLKRWCSWVKQREDVIIHMGKWRCEVCSYIYDESEGDPEGDIPAATPFSDLPDDWECPVCGVGKGQFERLGEAEKKKNGADEVVRRYTKEKLTVMWRPSLCNHNGNCTRRLPEVFDPERRPWVDLTRAESDIIREVVDECPTGALSYRLGQEE